MNDILTGLGLKVQGHLKIFEYSSRSDYQNNKPIRKLLDHRNAVHKDNASILVINAITQRTNSAIRYMVFGNAGTTIGDTGTVSFKPTNDTNYFDADLYNPVFHQMVDDRLGALPGNSMAVRHIANSLFTDIDIRALIDVNEPFGQSPSNTLNDITEPTIFGPLKSQFSFDEIGLKLADSTLITHVIFTPILKTASSLLEVVYTLRIAIQLGVSSASGITFAGIVTETTSTSDTTDSGPSTPGIFVAAVTETTSASDTSSATGGAVVTAICTFTNPPIKLGLLSGGSESQAWGINADGSIVVGFGTIPGGQSRALHWSDGVVTNLGALPGANASEALACSDDGSIIVGKSNGSGLLYTAVYWDSGVIHDLGALPTATNSRALGCNSTGDIIVGSSTVASGEHAVYWDHGVIHDLGSYGVSSQANACSADGSIAVGFGFVGGDWHALTWTSGGSPVELGTLPGGNSSWAYGCSADASIITGKARLAGKVRAVYWDHGVIHELGFLPGGDNSIATNCSADGTIIVGFSNGETPSGGQDWGFFWRDGVMQRLPIGTPTGTELVTNGGFVGGTTGWTLQDNATYGSNSVIVTYSGGNPYFTQSINTVLNVPYLITFTISDCSPGDTGAAVYIGDSFASTTFYGNGTHEVIRLGTETGPSDLTFEDWMYNDGDTWTITNISVKQMTTTALPSITAQNISGDGEVIVGSGVYQTEGHETGALEWKCVYPPLFVVVSSAPAIGD